MEQVGEATSAGLGAVVSTFTLYPVNRVKILVQNQVSCRPKSPLAMLRSMLKEDGILSLYQGCSTALGKGFVNNFVFYFAFSLLRRLVFARSKATVAAGGGLKPSMVRSMLHGICAGLCVQLLMSPYDTALIQVMTQRSKEKQVGLVATVRRIFREQGLGGFYAGIVPMIVLTLNPGITTVVRNQLTRGRRLSPRQNFYIGAASKAIASMCTYPIVIAKVQLQSRRPSSSECKAGSSLPGTVAATLATGGECSLCSEETNRAMHCGTVASLETPQNPTMLSTLGDILRDQGVAGLYKGCVVQVNQAVAKEAILNMVRLEIYAGVMSVFNGTTSATRIGRKQMVPQDG